MPQSSEKIDWAKYKKELPDPTIAETLEKAVNSFNPPPFKVDIAAKQAEFKALEADAEKLVSASTARIAELETDLKRIRSEIAKVSTMTMDEAMASDPVLADKVDKEIEEGRWF